MEKSTVFIAGGTGYIGWPLIRELLERGHTVRALARAGSERYDRLPLVRARPGHRWPCILLPPYWLFERIPSTREGARHLGLITLSQMTRALVPAIEKPASGERILNVPQIRAALC